MADKTNNKPKLFTNLSPREKAIGIILAIIALAGIYPLLTLLRTNEDKPTQDFELTFDMNVNDTLRLCPDSSLVRETGPLRDAELCDPAADRSLYGNFQIEPDGCLTFRSFGQVGRDSLCIQAWNEQNEPIRLLYKITVERKIEEDTAGMVISIDIAEPGEENLTLGDSAMKEKAGEATNEEIKEVEQTAYCGDVNYIRFPLTNETARPALEEPRRYAMRKIKAVILYGPPAKLSGQNARKTRRSINGGSGSFATHFVVDNREILEIIPEKEVVRHLRGRSFLPPARVIREGELSPNYFSLSVMMASPEKGDFAKVYSNAVRLIACLLDKHRLTTENLYRHFDLTGKNDPLFLLSGQEWELFKKAVSDQIDKESKIKG